MASPEIDERKRELRAFLKQLRTEMGADARAAADAGIESRVCELMDFMQIRVLLTYLDVGCEVRTRGIIERAWAAGRVVALPRCVPGTREMRWYRITSFDGLVRGKMGIEEPVPNGAYEQPLSTGESMMALVPGLTFDHAGYRLGYGGGFYDSFLAGFGGVSVGLCREAQLSADLHGEGVVDDHDLPVQLVATEKRVLA